MEKKQIIGFAVIGLGIALIGSSVFFYTVAQKQKRQNEAMQDMMLQAQGISSQPAVKEEIWIGSEQCKLTDGYNIVAFCDGISKDTSVWLDNGADAAVKECLEYTAGKLGRNPAESKQIACEVKAAYQNKESSFDFETGDSAVGIDSTNYDILNEWVNQ